jgi:spore germination protein YaaH
MSKQGELSTVVKYDEKSSVKWMTYGSNQWVSFDDAESFQAKLKY